jgi:crossover junction endodeoxyribonuclease RuvC
MRLIGLDPGLRLTGWGVIDVEGNRLRHVAHGVIKVRSRGSLAERLNELFDAIGRGGRRAAAGRGRGRGDFLNVNPARP